MEDQKKGWIKMEDIKKACAGMEFEKTKVTEADVVVKRTSIGFYFEIKYKEIGDEYYNVGFGSYNIHFVFGWLDKYFEFVKR